jgi:putative aldouronate transport system permease protein
MVGEHNLTYKIAQGLIYVILALLALATLLPFIHLISVSLSSMGAVDAGLVGIWPVRPHLDNYVFVFQDKQVFRALSISVVRLLLGVGLNLFVITLTAYPLSLDRVHMPGRTAFKLVMLFGMLFSAGLIPYFLSMRNLGLLDNFMVLILPPALNIFYTIVMINFFRGILSELADAAFVDGASHFDVLCRIYVPISLPSLATITVFSAVQHWNAWFDGILFLRQASMWPLQSLAYQKVTMRQVEWISKVGFQTTDFFQITPQGLSAAFVMFAAVPIMLVYHFLQRYFLTGLTLGSVKG